LSTFITGGDPSDVFLFRCEYFWSTVHREPYRWNFDWYFLSDVGRIRKSILSWNAQSISIFKIFKRASSTFL